MATIANLENAAEDFLAAGSVTITDAAQAGVQLATDGNISAFTSSTNNVDLAGTEVDNVVLTGDQDLDVSADDDGNIVVGNAGNNT